MISLQNKLQDAANDSLIRAALPTLTRLVEPILAEIRENARALLLGDVPPTLAARLYDEFGDSVSVADVRAIWKAVGLAVSDGRPQPNE